MKNRIKGYKAYTNMMDKYGNTYELQKEYSQNGDIKFGINGFHFCTHIADVFRYYDGFDSDTNICEIEGYGELNKYDDEYNEYFNMYASSKIKILKSLSREEIIDAVLEENIFAALRFIQGYKLTEEEMQRFIQKYQNQIIQDYINYYQKNKKDTFQRKRK